MNPNTIRRSDTMERDAQAYATGGHVADSFHSSQQASEHFADSEKPHLVIPESKANSLPKPYQAPLSARMVNQVQNVFVKKQVFTYVHKTALKVDTRRLLFITLFLYLLEYCAIFALQLVSYLILQDQWGRSRYVTGLVLLLAYIPLCVALMALVNSRHKALVFFLKFLEFGIHIVLLGWAVAYLDFSLMALSYVMVLNILVLYFFVG